MSVGLPCNEREGCCDKREIFKCVLADPETTLVLF